MEPDTTYPDSARTGVPGTGVPPQEREGYRPPDTGLPVVSLNAYTFLTIQPMPQPLAPCPTALVTGASSGLGLEFARLLARDGNNVIVTARTQPALEALAHELSTRHHVTVTPIVADLTEQDAPRQLYETIQASGQRVDILINNAGFGLAGRFDRNPLQRELDMIQVNIGALTTLTKLFLPDMLARKQGRIMNVASTAAFQPGPYMAVYYATKAYVLSFTEAIANELGDSGVTFTALCPGPTRTAFAHTAHINKPWGFLSARLSQSAEEVAQFGYDAMQRGTLVAIPGVINRLGVFGTRFSRRIATQVSRRLQHAD